MPGYTYENFLPDEPIVIYTALEEWNTPENLAASDDHGRDIIFNVDQPIFWILDISQITLDITSMMMFANKYTRGEDATWTHPNVRQLCIITTDELVHQMAAGMRQSDAFGYLDVKIFPNRDEALVFARETS
ncbi:MAG: hypothetical protein JXA10_19460 [Anaerolineae bacterium]|nr:hypothetical protein [Anaerolineae bacterium]